MRRAVGALLQRAARTTDSNFFSHEAVLPQVISSAVSLAAGEHLVPPLPTASVPGAEGLGRTLAAASPDAAAVTQFEAYGAEECQPGLGGTAVCWAHHHGAASQAATPTRCRHHTPAPLALQPPLQHPALSQQLPRSTPSFPAQHARHHLHTAHRCVSTSAGPCSASEQPVPPADPVNAELLSRRNQLYDALTRCMTVQQLDALLADADNRAAMDEMLLLTALNVAHGLCSSNSAASSLSHTPTHGLPGPASSKLASEAASDALCRLSELLIQMLSQVAAGGAPAAEAAGQGTGAAAAGEGISPEGAVRAMRILAALRFNPGGDYTGLLTISTFYREVVLPALDARARADPAAALQLPDLLVEMFFAFARLFEAAARREREMFSAAMEEAAAAARSGAAAAYPALPPVPSDGPTVVVGDRQLYDALSQRLARGGTMQELTPRSLSTLASAMSTSRVSHLPLVQAVALQTLARLQPGMYRPGAADALPPGADAAAPAPPSAMPLSTLSNIVSCLAELGFEDPALCDGVAAWTAARLATPRHGAQPHQLAVLAVAFARAKYENRDFLLQVCEAVKMRFFTVNAQTVAALAWALANSKVGSDPVFRPFLTALGHRLVALLRISQHHQHQQSEHHTAAATHEDSSDASHDADADSQPSSSSSSSSSSPSSPSSASSAPLPPRRSRWAGAVVPRHLAATVHAFAQLRFDQAELMEAVAADVEARAQSYQARQLVTILRAFSTLDGNYRPEMYRAACAVLEDRVRQNVRAAADARAAEAALADAAAAAGGVGQAVQLPQAVALTASHCVDLAWALARVGHCREAPALMDLLAVRVCDAADSLSLTVAVRAAESFATAGYTDARLYDRLAQVVRPLLLDLGPPFLASLVESMAAMGYAGPEAFWTGCLEAVGMKLPHLDRPDRIDMRAATARLHRALSAHPTPAVRSHYVVQQLQALLAKQY